MARQYFLQMMALLITLTVFLHSVAGCRMENDPCGTDKGEECCANLECDNFYSVCVDKSCVPDDDESSCEGGRSCCEGLACVPKLDPEFPDPWNPIGSICKPNPLL